MLYASLIILFWLVFFITWAVSAIGIKKDVTKGRPWWKFFLIRIALIIFLIWLLNQTIFTSFWVDANSLPFFSNIIVRVIGTILCGAGVAFAIWARRHLGRNWSGTPQMKQDHELITSGPYTFVRHPIYTGMLMALFGSALVDGPGWFVVLILFIIIVMMRIPKEERYMMQLFPGQYPEYKERTKALVPFIW